MASSQAPLRKGTRVSRLPKLEPLLTRWISVTDSLAARWIESAGDVPWWYNERASLSIFAGAIWQCSGWAFEEFQVAKQVATHGSRRSEQSGRCDIDFAIHGHEYVAEAKQAWPKIDVVGNATRVMTSAVDDALSDAKEIAHWGIPALAIVFVAPRLQATQASQADHFISRFLYDLLAIKGASLAWTFPPFARNMRPEGRNSHRIYPGAALVIVRAT